MWPSDLGPIAAHSLAHQLVHACVGSANNSKCLCLHYDRIVAYIRRSIDRRENKLTRSMAVERRVAFQISRARRFLWHAYSESMAQSNSFVRFARFRTISFCVRTSCNAIEFVNEWNILFLFRLRKNTELLMSISQPLRFFSFGCTKVVGRRAHQKYNPP